MEIAEIYTLFDAIGCCTFATIDGDYPETRIARFAAYDHEGLYFMTSTAKPFYKQLKETGKVSVCGMNAKTAVAPTADGSVHIDAGYMVRLSGDVREVSTEELRAKNNDAFAFCLADQERYPADTVFVVYRAKGEIFDYDFEKEYRDHKLERERFSYGGFPIVAPGLTITDQCVGCGTCQDVCTFDAVVADGARYRINGNRCDECGTCVVKCPVGAILDKGGHADR